MKNDDSTRSSGSKIATALPNRSRRDFLRRTCATAVGVGVLGGFADHARADAVLPPIVSTRDYYRYERDGQGPGAPYTLTLADGYTETDYELGMGTPGLDAPCDEVAVIVHGWDNDEDDAREKFATAVMELAPHYSGRFVGYSWDADISGGGVWKGPREAANRNGTHLAQFLVDLRNACMSSRIHLLGHSLGARVVLSALDVLNDRDDWLSWYKLHSVCLFGAAVDNETPAVSPYNSAIQGETGRTFNFYSTEDDVLSGFYWLVESDQALGEHGVESGQTPPENYTDIDVTSSVGDEHSGYLDTISEQMADKMQW